MASNQDDNDPGEKTAVLKGDQETLKRELQQAKQQDACLIVVRGTPQGTRFFLSKSEMIAGRDPTADISIQTDSSISRKHGKFTKLKRGDKEEVVFTDLGSSNGSFINNKRVNSGESTPLAKEDMVRLGSTILKFLPAGELEIIYYGNLGDAVHLDPMTKVFNKGYLMDALDAEFKRAKALHTDLTVVFLDLDHFKKLNDGYGHDAGDHVLKEFSNLVRNKYVRPKDIFARYGGEEFVLLLANTGAEEGSKIAENIRAAVEAHPFIYEGKRLPVSSSIGVAEISTAMESSQTLLKAADKALYQSKQSGRNRVTVA